MTSRPQADTGLSAKHMQAALLKSIRADLDLIIQPTLTTPEARMAAQLASEMLAWLTVGLRDLPANVGALRDSLMTLNDRAAVLLRDAGLTEPPPAPPVASELYDDDELSRLTAQFAARLAALQAPGVREHDAKLSAAIAELANDAVQLEQREQLHEYALTNAELADHADPVAAVEVELTPERFTRFLQERLAARSPGDLEHLERVPGGYSKDTYRLRLSRGLDGHRALVLRRDLPFGPGENSVVEEYELLHRLADAGLRVPRPLYQEPDASYVGRPFLLFPQYPGKAVFGDWHADKEEQRRVCLQVAELMAKLHSLDPVALGLASAEAVRSPQETVRAYVRLWRDKWLRRRSHPSLILATAFDWLERNAPANVPKVSLIHGDINFRNTLIEQGSLTVLLDWEFWHLGDPMEDLSYFRLVAEPYVAWDEIMAAYQAAGGIAYDPERAAFYEVWRSVRNGTTTTTAWHGFLHGAYPASKAAYQGLSLYRLFLRDVADKLQNVKL
jgi:aminoglycoside phosphotransferase (APT) family kinase protein